MTTEPAAHPYVPSMNELCLGVMDAVGGQPGDTPARTASRRRAIADTMSSMLPLDPLETMLAGQCVMFNEVIRDATGDLLHGQTEDIKLRVRPQICSTGRTLLATLTKLEQVQARAAVKFAPQKQAAPAPAEPARPAAKAPATGPAAPQPAPEPAQKRAPEPTPVSASASTPEPASTEAASAPARDASTEPARDQPTPEVPDDVRRELAKLLTLHGPTRADIDDALIAACRELPLQDRAQDRGATSAQPEPGDTRQAKRTKELV